MNASKFTRIAWSLLEDDRLTASSLAVFASLSSYADASLECFPSLQAISQRAHLSENAARNAIKLLRECGYLSIKHSRRGARQGPNYYKIFFQPAYFEPSENEPSENEPSFLEPSENACFQTAKSEDELYLNITKPFTASPSGKNKKEKALPEIALELEKILKAECDLRGITWEYAKERKNLKRLVSLKADWAALLGLARKFIELTKSPGDFLYQKPPTASMLKATLTTVEASLSKTTTPQRLLKKAVKAFTCSKCSASILEGDIACPECGAFVQDMEGALV